MNDQKPQAVMSANIHIPEPARILAKALKNGDSAVVVCLVGGAVRDYLFHKFHTDQSQPYKPKDIDLTTNLSEEEILSRLRAADRRLLITVKEKESVDTFGVVFCSVGGHGPFEIAPFRKDGISSDGRHPDKVERGNILEDAMRRDFTVNNLYYDFENHVIMDFNENGRGIEDIKARNIRCVGNPRERFEEDKLRILRLVRFFSRYNNGLIVEHLDETTLKAIEEFKDLNSFKGMSPERIMTEFLMGLSQSLNLSTYLQNYADLDLFKSVFDNTPIDLDMIPKLGDLENTRNPRVVLAKLLHKHKNAGEILNKLKYPNEISDAVQFLIDAMTFYPKDIVDLLKARDKHVIKSNKRELTEIESVINSNVISDTRNDIFNLMWVTEDRLRVAILEHLASFTANPPSGEHFISRGFKGPEIGEQQRAWIQSKYISELTWYLKTRNLEMPS